MELISTKEEYRSIAPDGAYFHKEIPIPRTGRHLVPQKRYRGRALDGTYLDRRRCQNLALYGAYFRKIDTGNLARAIGAYPHSKIPKPRDWRDLLLWKKIPKPRTCWRFFPRKATETSRSMAPISTNKLPEHLTCRHLLLRKRY